MLRKKNLKKNIDRHSRSSTFFLSWTENQRCKYHVVSASMEPNRDPFWGYCAESGEYFISENVPQGIVRNAILQAVHYRISKGATHFTAAQFVISKRDGEFPQRHFAETMLAFYSWEENELNESGLRPDDNAKDISSTVAYLKILLGI